MTRAPLSAVALLALSACSHNREIDEFPAKVGIVVPPAFFVSEVSAPFDIYSHAGDDKTDVFFIAETADPVIGYYGEEITPDYTFDDAPDLDVLVVPSGGGSRDKDLTDDAYIGYIKDAAKNAAFVTSHCWGAFALAAAGVLDGRSATTFPGYTDQLAEDFPKIKEVVTDQRWVQDDYIVTSNGGMAAYEASLHVVEQIFGQETSDEVAAGLVFDDANTAFAADPKITSVPGSSETVPELATPRNVAILIMDGLFINEAIGPYDTYAHGGYGASMNVYFVAQSMDPITGSYGERITPDYTFDTAPQADILVVPSGMGSRDAMLADTELIDWVKTQAAGAEWVTSNCWGAFTLASAGLLDGKTVTTFPGYFDELHTAFPSIATVVEDSRVVVDGNIVTSNGGLAAYESALYVVERELGPPADDVIAGGLVFTNDNLDNARNPLVAE